MQCYICHKHINEGEPTTNLDYVAATGKPTFPSVNAPNYDDRYGFTVHAACAKKRYAALDQKKGR